MSQAVDAKGRVQHEDVAHYDREPGHVPFLARAVHGHQGRDDEAHCAHEEVVVPVIQRMLRYGVG